jgi:hypothetical protein
VVKRIIQVDTVLFQKEVTGKGHRLFLGVAIQLVAQHAEFPGLTTACHQAEAAVGPSVGT